MTSEITAPCFGALSRHVAALCDDASFRERHLQDQLEKIRASLRAPLRIALAGRVSAGKSTCVNALLATRIAPVGDGETTKVLYHFADGDVESVVVVLRDGRREEIYLNDDGALPDTLPVPLDAVQRVEVYIPYAPLLKAATLIDTPGMSSARQDASERTAEFLFSADSRAALAGADALLFLLHGYEDEADALAAFQDLTGGSSACSVNAIGLISQADKLGDRDDPMGAAWRIARRLSQEPRLRARVATVIPILALIAETLETGGLTMEDKAALTALAAEDEVKLEDILYSAQDFLETPCGVSPAARDQLLRRLDMHGIRVAVRALQSRSTPAELEALLLEESGFGRLRGMIRDVFTQRADLLKADQALTALERLTYQADESTGAHLRTRIEQVRLTPAMHALREIWALGQHSRGEVDGLPDWLEDRLLQVTQGETTAERLGLGEGATAEAVKPAALEGATVCRTYANESAATVAQRAVADTLRTSYELILRDVLQVPRATGAGGLP